MINKIGENAGKVWTLLNQNGTMNASKLKTGLKLSESDFNLAIGWLARENKLHFTQIKNGLSISLR